MWTGIFLGYTEGQNEEVIMYMNVQLNKKKKSYKVNQKNVMIQIVRLLPWYALKFQKISD